MTTIHPRDPQGEIALPRFENRLWTELAREHRARLAAAPGRGEPGAGEPGRGLGPRRRRRGAGRLAVGIAATAAAAAAVVAVVAWPGDGTRRADVATGPAEDAPAAPGPDAQEPPADDLAERIAAANEAPDPPAIVRVTQDNADYGDETMWTDEATGAVRSLSLTAAGENSWDSGPIRVAPGDGASGQRTVDYCFEQYEDRDGPELPVPAGSATAWVTNGLRDGSLQVGGTQVVDGRELILLREVLGDVEPSGDGWTSLGDGARGAAEDTAEEPSPDTSAPDASGGAGDDDVLAWVLIDPETYRPAIRVGYPAGDEFSLEGAMYVQTYEYLPRTPENLAELAVPAPEGFARVDQLHSDGERADANCPL
ncbi:MAG TPA: hypothetical protein VIL48_07720 [Acidimicrobiales bacterium]